MYYTENMTGPECVSTIYECGAPIGVRILVKNPTLGMILSRIEDISVQFNKTVYTADQLTFVLRGIHYTFEDMKTNAVVRWEFAEQAELLVPRPVGLGALGVNKIQVKIGFRFGFENIQWRIKEFMVESIGESA